MPDMDTNARRLFARLWDDPRDEVRLIAADCLEEQGDTRGFAMRGASLPVAHYTLSRVDTRDPEPTANAFALSPRRIVVRSPCVWPSHSELQGFSDRPAFGSSDQPSHLLARDGNGHPIIDMLLGAPSQGYTPIHLIDLPGGLSFESEGRHCVMFMVYLRTRAPFVLTGTLPSLVPWRDWLTSTFPEAKAEMTTARRQSRPARRGRTPKAL